MKFPFNANLVFYNATFVLRFRADFEFTVDKKKTMIIFKAWRMVTIQCLRAIRETMRRRNEVLTSVVISFFFSFIGYIIVHSI